MRAKQYARVRSGIRFNTFIGTAYTTIAWVMILLFPRFWFGFFSDDLSMIGPGTEAMQIYFVGFVFMAEPVSNLIGGLASYITMRRTVYKRIENAIKTS